jgi:hypothetical protein
MNNKPEVAKSPVSDKTVSEKTETDDDRREVLKKLGKFAAYSAPFTVLAFSAKAATASGPVKSSRPR